MLVMMTNQRKQKEVRMVDKEFLLSYIPRLIELFSQAQKEGERNYDDQESRTTFRSPEIAQCVSRIFINLSLGSKIQVRALEKLGVIKALKT